MQRFNFTEGINKDVSVELLKPSQYRDALNVRMNDSVGGNEFSLTNLKGNTKVNYTLPEGKNVVIGSKEDVENSIIYYFIFNDRNDHQIVKYNYRTNTINQLVEGIGLRFEETKKIRDVVILGNRYLDWAQEGKEMGSIDVEETYPTINDNNRYLIEKAKQPHQGIISATYQPNPDLKDNNLRGKLWQFAVIYTFKDNTRSTVSGRGIIATPSTDGVGYYGGVVPLTQDNEITIEAFNGGDNVKTVELAARAVAGFGVLGEWFIAEEYNVEEISDETIGFTFANNKFLRQLDNNEAIQIGNFFPRNPKNLVYGYGRREFMSNFEEGFDAPNLNASVSWSYNNPATDNTSTLAGTVSASNVVDNSQSEVKSTTNSTQKVTRTVSYSPAFNEIQFKELSPNSGNINPITVDILSRSIFLTGAPRQGDKITIELDLTNFRYFEENQILKPLTPFTANYSKTIEYVVTQDDLEQNSFNNYYNLNQNLADAVNNVNLSSSNNIGGVVAIPAEVQNTTNGIQIKQAFFNKVNGFRAFARTVVSAATVTITTSTSFLPPEPTFKRGLNHEFAVAYEDEKGRLSKAYTVDTLKGSPLISTSVNPSPLRGSVDALIEIGSLAPIGATHYHILHRVVKPRYLQFIGELTDLGSNDEYEISLADLTAYNTKYQSSILNYEFVRGDKIRILRTSTGTIIQPSSSQGVTEEVEILSYDDSNNKITFKFDQTTTPVLTTGVKYLFEIIGATPEDNNNLFFETGYSYPVLNRRHRSGESSDEQNQTSLQPAIVKISSYGDSYFRNRVFDEAAGVELFVEDSSVSDFFEATQYGAGRVNTVDDRARKVQRGTFVVFSEPFIDGSFVNGTSTVYDLSVKDYEEQYGDINKMYADGRRLTVFFESKVGLVGINQANVIRGAGGVSYDTSSVLNEMQFYDWEIGIGNAGESFSENKGVQFWIDNYRGAICKFAQNGLQQLQLRGLSGELTAKTKDTQNNPYKCLKTFHNTQYEEVGFMINNDTVISESDFLSKVTDNGEFLTITVSDEYFKTAQVGDKVTIRQTELGGGAPTYFIDESTITGITDLGNGVIRIGFEYSTTRPVAREAFNWQTTQIEFINRETYIYNDKINAWATRTRQNGEWAEFKNINFVTFKEGEVWVEESNTTRNNFYGEQYVSEAELYVNETPQLSKRVLTIEEQSTTPWTLTLESNTPSGDNDITFQQSNLITEDFVKKLNFWVSGFWKDINTPNVTSPLINGDDIRGQYVKLLLSNNSTELEKLFTVGVKYEIDRLSSDE